VTRRALLPVILGLGLALGACSSPAPAPAPSLSATSEAAPESAPQRTASEFADSFVQTDGSAFTVAGEEFAFVGANIYDAAATDRYSCRAGTRMSDDELTRTLEYLRDEAGASVIRFWAYQPYTQGGTYWDGIDRVLAVARATGMKVIPVLEDGPGDCTTSDAAEPKDEYEGDTWYTDGYRTLYGNATLPYRDYVSLVAQRYADDPTILGWSMMNEAETATRVDGRSALVPFAEDIASVIRAVDDRHLITVGTQSNGAPGASGPDFRDVYGLPDISFSEVHDWGDRGDDDDPMPGGRDGVPPQPDAAECRRTDAPIACSFALAPALGKPLIVGEAGIVGRTAEEREDRASALAGKMEAAFAAGAAGYLVWSVTTADTDGYDILIDRDDPLMPRMKEIAGAVG